MHFQSILFTIKDKPTLSIIKKELSDIYNDLEIAEDFYNLYIDKTGSIGIETVAELSQWNSMSMEEGHKLAIIFNAENLTQVAQNALLKIVEEPAQDTLIVLLTNNTDSILETLRSRTKQVALKSLHTDTSFDEIENLFKLSFSQRAVEFAQIATKDRSLQQVYLSRIYNYISKKAIAEKVLLETILLLQKSIRSQVQSSLIFDNLNIALNEVNFNLY